MTPALILGRCDTLRAEIYVRLTLDEGIDPAEATLVGTLTGPECRRAITLPAVANVSAVRGTVGPDTAAARSAASARSLVSRAILTEPSYWTPEMPNLYRFEGRLLVRDREVAAWRCPVGIRRLGVRGRSLWLDGRRYVPRGLVTPEDAVDLPACREAAVALCVADPSEALLARCDAEGVPVLGMLAHPDGVPLDAAAATERVVRQSWHASLLMAIVPEKAATDVFERLASDTRGARNTLLLAREVDGSKPPTDDLGAADALVVSLAADAVPSDAWRAVPRDMPLIARRPGVSVDVPSRRPCDVLQASLAAWYASAAGSAHPLDWAGYVVDICARGD